MAAFEGPVFYGSDIYASADFPDAEDTRPVMSTDTALIPIGEGDRISVATENLIRKHTQEIQGKGDIYISHGGNITNQLRRKLREFYMKEQQALFQFLEQPATAVPVVSAYTTIMKRFSRPDFTLAQTSLKDLCVDLNGETVLPELNERLGFDLATFTGNLGSFMNVLKEVADEIMRSEDALKVKVGAIDKLTQTVQTVLTLSSANPVYEGLIKSTEAYICEAISQNSLEESYTNLINSYKKLAVMNEAFIGARVLSSAAVAEPLCSVCISEPVNFCFSPCGHTFCQGCARKQNLQCFICRQMIRERVKLYFS